MSYTVSNVSFPSSDGISTVHGIIYIPDSAPRGVVQLSHGMVDHVGRYEALGKFLAECGYVFAGNDHIGHGMTADKSGTMFGYFTDKGGTDLVLRDLHSMNKLLRERFGGMKPVIMGHSMGSFLSRLYVEKYPNSISGHIIHGTGGPLGAAVPLGIGLVNLIMLFRGTKYRSSLVKSIAFAGYNSHFPKEEGPNAWLTRDLSTISGHDSNSYTNFTFTVSAYKELFQMVGKSNSKNWFASYPKQLKTLILSGDEDPVGDYGNGVRYVYKQLLLSSVEELSMKLYEGARHELFNETNRDEVFADMKSFLDRVFK
ncbi:MAG: alpha/beta fold hydrolase [Clostridia bacterium]|nr:alpha/beta fold hydrolase [Clostridia bacterium]